jgi:hypothetical protein
VRSSLSRRLGRAGGALVGVAVAARVLTLSVAPATRLVDAGMAALAVCVAVVLVRLPSGWEPRRPLIAAGAAVGCALLAAVGLHVAAQQIPDFAMIAVLSFAAIMVATETDVPETAPFAATAVVVAIFIGLWLTSAPGAPDVASLLVALALLIGLKLLAAGGAERTRRQIDAETRRGHAYASLGRKLGVARDVPSVASAVLEACLETFPETSTGMVLMNDAADGLLKSTGVFLSASGVTSGGPAYELAPGEGIAGAIFTAPGAELWPTTLSVSMA